jgi:hypothetical protein
MKTLDFFDKHKDACRPAIEFASQFETMAEAWDKSPRADWMLWAIQHDARKVDVTAIKRFTLRCIRETRLTMVRSCDRVPKQYLDRLATLVASTLTAFTATAATYCAAATAAFTATAATYCATTATAYQFQVDLLRSMITNPFIEKAKVTVKTKAKAKTKTRTRIKAKVKTRAKAKSV